MQRVALILSLAILVVPAHSAAAAPPTTVEELRQFLLAEKASKHSDNEIAGQISSVTLTEQLTKPTLTQICAESKPGPRTAEQLQLLSDSSILLAPPAAELPTAPTPDPAAQREIINSALNYVDVTLDRLPDFFAKRATRSFDDSPLPQSGRHAKTKLQLHQLHWAGASSHEVTYRDGREVVDVTPAALGTKGSSEPALLGLTTHGEFGPVLKIVLSDSFKGSVTWSRWEQTLTGSRVAVFHYVIPKFASHYLIEYCCYWKSEFDADLLTFRDKPGYHGDLYIDPATGFIDRFTLEAELAKSDPVVTTSIAVQYGQVGIDGHDYNCPINAVAISVIRTPDENSKNKVNFESFINEITFSDYHKFGSTARILPAGSSIDTP